MSERGKKAKERSEGDQECGKERRRERKEG